MNSGIYWGQQSWRAGRQTRSLSRTSGGIRWPLPRHELNYSQISWDPHYRQWFRVSWTLVLHSRIYSWRNVESHSPAKAFADHTLSQVLDT